MKRHQITLFILICLLGASNEYVLAQAVKPFRHTMMVFPESGKYTVAEDDNDEHCPFSKHGWYYSQVGVETTSKGLVAVYRRADYHTANYTDIMVAYSNDGGKSWEGHHSISHADVWNEGGCWVAPQFSKLKDGRLVIIADFGKRNPGNDWPMLSQWQMPNRGMANYLFWSEDEGRTWSEPILCDEVGGEPGYITELSNGDLIFSRTQAKQTDKLWHAPMPWGNTYYYNEAVISKDGGKTWPLVVPLADDPHHGDCEVGIAETSPGKLIAMTRVGFGGGAFAQPSRIAYSDDYGRTWKGHKLSPIYGQRTVIHPLQSGKVLVTYRSRWGTPGTYAVVFDPNENLDYEPSSFIYREEHCSLSPDGIMTFKTDEGSEHTVIYSFYPAQSDKSRVEIQADLRLESAELNACIINAGCELRFEKDKISLVKKPEVFVNLDASAWHHYKIVRERGTLTLWVDGKQSLKTSIEGLESRMVQVGNRMDKGFNLHKVGGTYANPWNTKGKSQWKSLSVKVDNVGDYSIDWKWNPAKGYPDQFRRDRIVVLDRTAASHGDSGYSGWTQAADGSIIIADYTVGGNGGKPAPSPFVRAYLSTEKELSSNAVDH